MKVFCLDCCINSCWSGNPLLHELLLLLELLGLLMLVVKIGLSSKSDRVEPLMKVSFGLTLKLPQRMVDYMSVIRE